MIIKNCPAYMYDKQFNRNVCKKNLIPYETCCEECQDINDCVMKQIVKQAGYCLCPEILDLLDIEECE